MNSADEELEFGEKTNWGNGVGAGDGEEAFFSCEDPNSLTHSRALASSSMQLHQPCRSLPDFPVSDFVEPSFILSDLTTRSE